MNKQTKTIIIIILGILTAISFALGTIGFLNNGLNNEEKNKPSDKEDDSNNEEDMSEEEDDNSNLKYKLNVYKDGDGNICLTLSSECHTLANTIGTETHNAKILSASAGSNYILIKDGDLKLVDLKNKTIKKVALENTYDIYTLNTNINNDEETLYGIVYYENTDRNNTVAKGYYNYETSKKTALQDYDYLYFINNEYIGAYNLTTKKDYILNVKDGSVVFEFARSTIKDFKCSKEYPEPTHFRTPNGENYYLTIFKNSDKNIVEVVCKNETNENVLYTIDGNQITERALIEVLDDEIYTIKDDVLVIYDFDGLAKDTKTLTGYNFEFITQNYAVGINKNNNELTIINLNTLESTKLMDWSNDYYFADRSVMNYGYALSGLHEDNKNKIGIYVIIGDSSRQKINGLGQGFEIYFNPNTKKVEISSIAKIKNAI